MTDEQQDGVFEDGDGSLVINMEDVEASSYEILPKGTYDVVVDECEFKFSNASGKPMWSLSLVVTSGDYKGRKLFHNMSFSEAALPSVKAQIADVAPELITTNFDPKVIAEEGTMIGKKARAKVKHEKYQGEDKARVGGLQAPKDGGDDFLDD